MTAFYTLTLCPCPDPPAGSLYHPKELNTGFQFRVPSTTHKPTNGLSPHPSAVATVCAVGRQAHLQVLMLCSKPLIKILAQQIQIFAWIRDATVCPPPNNFSTHCYKKKFAIPIITIEYPTLWRVSSRNRETQEHRRLHTAGVVLEPAHTGSWEPLVYALPSFHIQQRPVVA